MNISSSRGMAQIYTRLPKVTTALNEWRGTSRCGERIPTNPCTWQGRCLHRRRPDRCRYRPAAGHVIIESCCRARQFLPRGRWPLTIGKNLPYEAIADRALGMFLGRFVARRRIEDLAAIRRSEGERRPSRSCRTFPSPATTAGPMPFPTSADPFSTSLAMAPKATAGETINPRSRRRSTPPKPAAEESSSFRRARFASTPTWRTAARSECGRACRLARERGRRRRNDYPG